MSQPENGEPAQKQTSKWVTRGVPIAAIGALFIYWNAFPNGVLDYLVGREPSTAENVCVGATRSPLCLLFSFFGAEHAQTELALNRQARLNELGKKYGIAGEFRISGGSGLSEEEDRTGYEEWLASASEEEFELVFRQTELLLARTKATPKP